MSGKFPGKLSGHIITYLVTIPADRWSNGTQHILRLRAKGFSHRTQCLFPHPVHRASPSGMGQADDPMNRIHKIQRYTVRIKSHETNSGKIRNQSVHILIITLCHDSLSQILFCHQAHIRGMCLMRHYHMINIRVQGLRNSPVILPYCLRIILHRKAEIGGRIDSFTDTTQSGGKKMIHNPRLLQ